MVFSRNNDTDELTNKSIDDLTDFDKSKLERFWDSENEFSKIPAEYKIKEKKIIKKGKIYLATSLCLFFLSMGVGPYVIKKRLGESKLITESLEKNQKDSKTALAVTAIYLLGAGALIYSIEKPNKDIISLQKEFYDYNMKR